MTVKEFYELAVSLGKENYTMIGHDIDDYEVEICEEHFNDKWKEVFVND